MATMQQEIRDGASTVKEFCRRNKISRPTFYKEITGKRLRAVKVGAKTLVLDSDERAWKQCLQQVGSAA
jgi:excisionase family DNA binding protein